MKSFKLSPSALHLYLDCPRCFWLEKNRNIKRPRGIFPSLPGGMDRVIKDYFDACRAKKTLPPELRIPDFLGVELFEDQKQLDLWREWRTGLIYRSEDGSQLSGAFDELMVKSGKYIPFDYKTKGTKATEESSVKYYQHQLDAYALMLEANGLHTWDYGFLLYYSPKAAGEHGQIQFEIQPIRIAVDPARARKMFEDAIALLNGELPPSLPSCEYCAWLRNFKTPFKS